MKNKPSGKSLDIQDKLDHFIADISHMDEPRDTFSDDGSMPWLSDGSDDMRHEELNDVFKDEDVEADKHSKRRGTVVFGLLAVSTILIWFVWPTMDASTTKKLPLQTEAGGHVAMVPDSVVLDKPGVKSARQRSVPAAQKVKVASSKPPTSVRSSSVMQSSPAATVVKPVQAAATMRVTPAPAVALGDTMQTAQRKSLTISVNLGLIRDAPNKKGKVVARLKKGTHVMVISQRGDWNQVRFSDGRIAWGHQSIF